MNKSVKKPGIYFTNIIFLIISASLTACSQEQPPAVTQAVAPRTEKKPTPAQCDRHCLKGFIDQYLDALVKKDPTSLPLADNVVFVENDQRLQLGDGTWRTITGLGKYRHYFADPKTGQVAVMAVLKENDSDVIYDLRLAVADKLITEIEAMIIRTGPGGAKLLEDLGKPWPEFLETIPPEQRVSREDLITTANKYLSGMENNNPDGDYSFFDPECDRLEHGRKTTNNKPTEYGHSTDKEFVTMTCRQQFETGFLGFVTRIRDRRYVVVDEEHQTVFGLVVLDHNGTIRKINMSNNRVFVIPPYFSTPRTLQVGEAWRMRGHKLYKIEMTLNEFPYGTRPQFDRDDGNWLKYTGSNSTITAAGSGQCDRDCLEKQVEDLLEAMLAHDPGRLPLSASIKYTENGQRLAPGDGLWGTLTELGDFKVILADENKGVAGFYGNIIETDVPGLLTARLKIDGNQITEIEAEVVREEYVGERGGTLSLFAPRLQEQYHPAQFIKTVPSYTAQSNGNITEENLGTVVDSFYTGMQNHQGGASSFADKCRRRINGMLITNDKDASAPDPAVPTYRPYSLSCSEQIDAGVFNYITGVRDRRYLVIDARLGLVMDLVLYDVADPAQPIEVASAGTVTLPPASTGPYSMMATQIFQIVDGKIIGIETVLRPVPYGMPSGW